MKVPRTYRLPKETDEAIKVLAEKLGVSEAQIVVNAVAQYIPGGNAKARPTPIIDGPAAAVVAGFANAVFTRPGRAPILRPGEQKKLSAPKGGQQP